MTNAKNANQNVAIYTYRQKALNTLSDLIKSQDFTRAHSICGLFLVISSGHYKQIIMIMIMIVIIVAFVCWDKLIQQILTKYLLCANLYLVLGTQWS